MLFGIQFTPMVESKENCLPTLLTQSRKNTGESPLCCTAGSNSVIWKDVEAAEGNTVGGGGGSTLNYSAIKHVL